MHVRLLVTTNAKNGQTSSDIRTHVSTTLAADASFVGEGGLFASPIADWFVIGGRWSGALSRVTWAKDVSEQIAAIEEEHGIQVRGMYFGREEDRQRQAKLAAKVEALYASRIPSDYRKMGLCYNRDPYIDHGYADDAMLVNRQLYDALLHAYEGVDKVLDPDGILTFADLERDSVAPRFVSTKWVVVVDYHF